MGLCARGLGVCLGRDGGEQGLVNFTPDFVDLTSALGPPGCTLPHSSGPSATPCPGRRWQIR